MNIFWFSRAGAWPVLFFLLSKFITMKTRIFISVAPDGGIDYEIAGDHKQLAGALKTVAHYDKQLRMALNSIVFKYEGHGILAIDQIANAGEPSVGSTSMGERHKPADNE